MISQKSTNLTFLFLNFGQIFQSSLHVNRFTLKSSQSYYVSNGHWRCWFWRRPGILSVPSLRPTLTPDCRSSADEHHVRTPKFLACIHHGAPGRVEQPVLGLVDSGKSFTDAVRTCYTNHGEVKPELLCHAFLSKIFLTLFHPGLLYCGLSINFHMFLELHRTLDLLPEGVPWELQLLPESRGCSCSGYTGLTK